MVTLLIHNDAARFAEHLARLSPPDRCEAMANAVRESGGYLQRSQEDLRDLFGDAVPTFEVNHLGISAIGMWEFGAIQSWIRRARNAAKLGEAS